MIYCISDIHGEYKKYIKLLEKINFGENDLLYILGDVIDRGEQSMEVILDMKKRPNVVPIVGNHEYMAMKVLPKLSMEIIHESIRFIDMDTAFTQDLFYWLEEGGSTTVESFKKLSRNNQSEVLNYIYEFSLYEEIKINNREFLFVHAGLDNFYVDRPIVEYDLHELIFLRTDYEKPYFSDKIVVTGHTPTRNIAGNENKDKIFKKNNHIAIDCGAVFGGPLAAICLDTGEEFYVF